MPICATCRHPGADHNWLARPCPACGNKNWRDCHLCFENFKRARKRGQCRATACECPAYKPLTARSAPLNRHLARALYHKRSRD